MTINVILPRIAKFSFRYLFVFYKITAFDIMSTGLFLAGLDDWVQKRKTKTTLFQIKDWLCLRNSILQNELEIRYTNWKYRKRIPCADPAKL